MVKSTKRNNHKKKKGGRKTRQKGGYAYSSVGPMVAINRFYARNTAPPPITQYLYNEARNNVNLLRPDGTSVLYNDIVNAPDYSGMMPIMRDPFHITTGEYMKDGNHHRESAYDGPSVDNKYKDQSAAQVAEEGVSASVQISGRDTTGRVNVVDEAAVGTLLGQRASLLGEGGELVGTQEGQERIRYDAEGKSVYDTRDYETDMMGTNLEEYVPGDDFNPYKVEDGATTGVKTWQEIMDGAKISETEAKAFREDLLSSLALNAGEADPYDILDNIRDDAIRDSLEDGLTQEAAEAAAEDAVKDYMSPDGARIGTVANPQGDIFLSSGDRIRGNPIQGGGGKKRKTRKHKKRKHKKSKRRRPRRKTKKH